LRGPGEVFEKVYCCERKMRKEECELAKDVSPEQGLEPWTVRLKA
jgi:hypothetical protein